MPFPIPTFHSVHSAINNLLNNSDYHIPAATVLSNEREIYQDDKVTYMPVYLVMFMEAEIPQIDETEYLFWLAKSVQVEFLLRRIKIIHYL